MSADLLRRAAQVMRENATYAPDFPWAADIRDDGRAWIDVADEDGHAWGMHGFPAGARHVASWHPAVALAVADWLAPAADLIEHGDDGGPVVRDHAVAIARTYLGETP